MTRRRDPRLAAVGLAFVTTLGIAGCTAPVSETPAPSSAPAATPTSERDAYIAAGPEALDPARFEHGQFVGAIDMEYYGTRSSKTAQDADKKYLEYFKGSYTPPKPGDRNAIRLQAMGDPRDGNRLLFKGAIIDNITTPHAVVVGLHNITRIEGGVEVNGQTFEGRVAGAYGSLEIGDHMTVWVPDLVYPDLVNRYVYEVVPSDNGGDYEVVEVASGYEDIIYRASPSEDVYQLSLYTCWPPNQSIRRLVTRFHLVDASIEPGSVSPVEVAG